MSDMPNVIYAYEEYTGFVNGYWLKECTELTASLNGMEKYHHDSILQAKDRQNTDLQENNTSLVLENRDLKASLDSLWFDVEKANSEVSHLRLGITEALGMEWKTVCPDDEDIVNFAATLKSRIATLEKQLQDQALAELARIAQEDGDYDR